CCPSSGAPVNYFEIRLYEGQNRFDIVYGNPMSDRSRATIGIQKDTGSLYTQYICHMAGPTSGLQLTFVQPLCGTPTNTPTIGSPSMTRTPTLTHTPTVTGTPPTMTPTNTST